MFGIFRQSVCPLPDAARAVHVDDQDRPLGAVRLGQAELIAANEYLFSKPLAKYHADREESAKEVLKRGLGESSVGILPDGRTVTASRQQMSACTSTRKAHVRTTIAIQ